MQDAVNKLGETALFFGKCGKEGKYLIPVGNAYPFLMMMGKVVSGWLLLWQAGIAKEKLDVLCGEKEIDATDKEVISSLAKDNKDAAFYSGKLASTRYFIKNVLPEVDAAVKAIKSEDLSIMDIPDEGFAS